MSLFDGSNMHIESKTFLASVILHDQIWNPTIMCRHYPSKPSIWHSVNVGTCYYELEGFIKRAEYSFEKGRKKKS